MIATIGYERAELADFIATLKACEITALVDIRDRAQSRRPGFSKSVLANALSLAGIQYHHMPQLGDPKEGREAARRQDFEAFKAIFGAVMGSEPAREALGELAAMAANERICLMCYERDQLQCHRKIVADHLGDTLNIRPLHLGVKAGAGRKTEERRVRNPNQSTAAQVQQVF